MLTLHPTTKFKKDYKRAKSRNLNTQLLENVIQTLLEEKPLDALYLDHPLTGDWENYRECHIQNDWLFIYRIEKEKLILVAARTGTHADFGW
jgi:mRNA interferase YafQ